MVSILLISFSLEGGLITIEIIRTLLIDLLHIRIQYGRMQNIILVKQSDIISGSQLVTLVGVIGDTAVMIQVLIDDTAIRLRRVLLAEFLDIGVLRVGNRPPDTVPSWDRSGS